MPTLAGAASVSGGENWPEGVWAARGRRGRLRRRRLRLRLRLRLRGRRR
jgi:hypothetical protein